MKTTDELIKENNACGELEKLGYLLTETHITDKEKLFWIMSELKRLMKKWHASEN